MLRFYDVPSYPSARPGDAESIELMAWILGGDDTSRLYQRLVSKKLASAAGSDYLANTLDSGRLSFVVVPLDGVAFATAEAELDAVLAEVRANGVTQEELDRAKSTLEARRVFESDNQMTLARRYGEGVALGRSIADLDALPGRIQARTLDDIKRVAAEFLVAPRSVTGMLTPPKTAAAPATSTAPQAAKQ